MDAKYFEETKEKIKDELEKNNAKIKDLDYRCNIIEKNTGEYRLLLALTLSLLPYFIELVIIAVLSKFNVIPVEVVPFLPAISMVIPISIGVILENKNFQKNNLKEKLENFSKSKDSQDLITEKLEYELEKEKLSTKKQFMSDTYNSISKDQEIMNEIPQKYTVIEKEDNNLADVENNIENLKNDLNEKNNLLDLYISKIFILNKNSEIEYSKHFKNPTISLSVATFFELYFAMPILPACILPNIKNLSSLSMLNVIIPFVSSGIIYYKYANDKTKKQQIACNKIDEELDKQYIEKIEKTNDLCTKLINRSSKLIEEIKNITIELENQKFIKNYLLDKHEEEVINRKQINNNIQNEIVCEDKNEEILNNNGKQFVKKI